MSDSTAQAMVDVSKNTYVIPARHETFRWVIGLIFVGFVLYFLIPAFLAKQPDDWAIAIVIVAVIAIVSGDRLIRAAISAWRGKG